MYIKDINTQNYNTQQKKCIMHHHTILLFLGQTRIQKEKDVKKASQNTLLCLFFLCFKFNSCSKILFFNYSLLTDSKHINEQHREQTMVTRMRCSKRIHTLQNEL